MTIHFVKPFGPSWASRGAPVGREDKFRAKQREDHAKPNTPRSGRRLR
jgi:hypothetical protein